jgi:hypothetical protein
MSSDRLTAGDEKGLLIVAVRVDHPVDVQNRIKTVLALANTYDKSPDTTPSVWCKPQSELMAMDLDKLAYFIDWRGVRDLNVGDVVSPSVAYADGDADGQRGNRA